MSDPRYLDRYQMVKCGDLTACPNCTTCPYGNIPRNFPPLKPAEPPPLTEADIRRIVREELAALQSHQSTGEGK